MGGVKESVGMRAPSTEQVLGILGFLSLIWWEERGRIVNFYMKELCCCCCACQEELLVSKTLRLTEKEKPRREEQNEQTSRKSRYMSLPCHRCCLVSEVLFECADAASPKNMLFLTRNP